MPFLIVLVCAFPLGSAMSLVYDYQLRTGSKKASRRLSCLMKSIETTSNRMLLEDGIVTVGQFLF